MGFEFENGAWAPKVTPTRFPQTKTCARPHVHHCALPSHRGLHMMRGWADNGALSGGKHTPRQQHFQKPGQAMWTWVPSDATNAHAHRAHGTKLFQQDHPRNDASPNHSASESRVA